MHWRPNPSICSSTHHAWVVGRFDHLELKKELGYSNEKKDRILRGERSEAVRLGGEMFQNPDLKLSSACAYVAISKRVCNASFSRMLCTWLLTVSIAQ